MKIAMLGLGFMGSTHLKALKKFPQVELAAVASDDEKALTGDLSHIQGNIGGPGEKLDFSRVRKYRHFKEAIADHGIDAVDICLPTNMHEEAAIAALRAGKHVLIEKPMALDGPSADRILEEADKSGRILMIAQVLRFFPEYMALSESLKAGGMGKVRSGFFRRRCAAPAWGRWLGNASLSGGGVFDLLIHDIDFCLQLFGIPEAVSAVGYEDMGNGIDWILSQFHYSDIGPVIITGGWHHPAAYPFSMEYTVVSDGGTLEYSSAGRAPTLYRCDGKESALELQKQDGYEAEIGYFIDCCLNNRKPQSCPPEESAAAVKLTRLMLQARTRNGDKLECRI